MIIEPRKQWPTRLEAPKGRIAADSQARVGRALARLGDGGWDAVVEGLFALARNGHPFEVTEDMVQACAGVLKRWEWAERPSWICPMPSRRSQSVIDAVADAIGALGKLPVHRALVDQFQAEQANSAHQVLNVWHRLRVEPSLLPAGPVGDGPVLLIDDEVDSRWTITVASHRLVQAGTGPVLPFALRSR